MFQKMDAVWKRTMLLTSNTMKISVFPIRIIQLYQKYISRSTRPDIFCKKGVLRNFTKFTVKHLCQSLFFNKVAVEVACNFTKKETLVQVFSCEFCKISKNTFLHRTTQVADSETCLQRSFELFL